MQEVDLIASWKREAQQPFSGWDFSNLKGRYCEPSPPWSYEAMVRALLENADAVLDMGTGVGRNYWNSRSCSRPIPLPPKDGRPTFRDPESG